MPKAFLPGTAFAVTLLLLNSTALAADCTYETTEVDPFTGREFIATEWEKMTKELSDKYKRARGLISAIKDGDEYFLAIDMRIWDRSPEYFKGHPSTVNPPDNFLRNVLVADAGSKLMLRLADDSIIELQSDRRVRGDANAIGPVSQKYDNSRRGYWETYDIRATAMLRFPVDEDAYTALTSYPVTHVRLSANGRDHDFKLRKEAYGGINRALSCLATKAQAMDPAELVAKKAKARRCEYEENTVDKFTKTKIVRTDRERLTWGFEALASFTAHAYVRVDGDTKYLSIDFRTNDWENYRPRAYQLQNRVAIADGSKLLLWMEDGSTVELSAAAGSVSRGSLNPQDDGKFILASAGSVDYTLDEAAAKALVAQDAVYVRMTGIEKYANAYDDHFDFQIIDKAQGAIRNAVECAL